MKGTGVGQGLPELVRSEQQPSWTQQHQQPARVSSRRNVVVDLTLSSDEEESEETQTPTTRSVELPQLGEASRIRPAVQGVSSLQNNNINHVDEANQCINMDSFKEAEAEALPGPGKSNDDDDDEVVCIGVSRAEERNGMTVLPHQGLGLNYGNKDKDSAEMKSASFVTFDHRTESPSVLARKRKTIDSQGLFIPLSSKIPKIGDGKRAGVFTTNINGSSAQYSTGKQLSSSQLNYAVAEGGENSEASPVENDLNRTGAVSFGAAMKKRRLDLNSAKPKASAVIKVSPNVQTTQDPPTPIESNLVKEQAVIPTGCAKVDTIRKRRPPLVLDNVNRRTLDIKVRSQDSKEPMTQESVGCVGSSLAVAALTGVSIGEDRETEAVSADTNGTTSAGMKEKKNELLHLDRVTKNRPNTSKASSTEPTHGKGQETEAVSDDTAGTTSALMKEKKKGLLRLDKFTKNRPNTSKPSSTGLTGREGQETEAESGDTKVTTSAGMKEREKGLLSLQLYKAKTKRPNATKTSSVSFDDVWIGLASTGSRTERHLHVERNSTLDTPSTSTGAEMKRRIPDLIDGKPNPLESKARPLSQFSAGGATTKSSRDKDSGSLARTTGLEGASPLFVVGDLGDKNSVYGSTTVGLDEKKGRQMGLDVVRQRLREVTLPATEPSETSSGKDNGGSVTVASSEGREDHTHGNEIIVKRKKRPILDLNDVKPEEPQHPVHSLVYLTNGGASVNTKKTKPRILDLNNVKQRPPVKAKPKSQVVERTSRQGDAPLTGGSIQGNGIVDGVNRKRPPLDLNDAKPKLSKASVLTTVEEAKPPNADIDPCPSTASGSSVSTNETIETARKEWLRDHEKPAASRGPLDLNLAKPRSQKKGATSLSKPNTYFAAVMNTDCSGSTGNNLDVQRKIIDTGETATPLPHTESSVNAGSRTGFATVMPQCEKARIALSGSTHSELNGTLSDTAMTQRDDARFPPTPQVGSAVTLSHISYIPMARKTNPRHEGLMRESPSPGGGKSQPLAMGGSTSSFSPIQQRQQRSDVIEPSHSPNASPSTGKNHPDTTYVSQAGTRENLPCRRCPRRHESLTQNEGPPESFYRLEDWKTDLQSVSATLAGMEENGTSRTLAINERSFGVALDSRQERKYCRSLCSIEMLHEDGDDDDQFSLTEAKSIRNEEEFLEATEVSTLTLPKYFGRGNSIFSDNTMMAILNRARTENPGHFFCIHGRDIQTDTDSVRLEVGGDSKGARDCLVRCVQSHLKEIFYFDTLEKHPATAKIQADEDQRHSHFVPESEEPFNDDESDGASEFQVQEDYDEEVTCREGNPQKKHTRIASRTDGTPAESYGYHKYINKTSTLAQIEFRDFPRATVNSSIWNAHKEVFGHTCSDECGCWTSLGKIVKTAITDLKKRKKVGKSFPSSGKVGFSTFFEDKFADLLRNKFPSDSSYRLYERLVELWEMHKKQRRFGLTCRRTCECGELWTSFSDDNNQLLPGIRPMSETRTSAAKVPRRRRPTGGSSNVQQPQPPSQVTKTNALQYEVEFKCDAPLGMCFDDGPDGCQIYSILPRDKGKHDRRLCVGTKVLKVATIESPSEPKSWRPIASYKDLKDSFETCKEWNYRMFALCINSVLKKDKSPLHWNHYGAWKGHKGLDECWPGGAELTSRAQSSSNPLQHKTEQELISILRKNEARESQPYRRVHFTNARVAEFRPKNVPHELNRLQASVTLIDQKKAEVTVPSFDQLLATVQNSRGDISPILDLLKQGVDPIDKEDENNLFKVVQMAKRLHDGEKVSRCLFDICRVISCIRENHFAKMWKRVTIIVKRLQGFEMNDVVGPSDDFCCQVSIGAKRKLVHYAKLDEVEEPWPKGKNKNSFEKDFNSEIRQEELIVALFWFKKAEDTTPCATQRIPLGIGRVSMEELHNREDGSDIEIGVDPFPGESIAHLKCANVILRKLGVNKELTRKQIEYRKDKNRDALKSLVPKLEKLGPQVLSAVINIKAPSTNSTLLTAAVYAQSPELVEFLLTKNLDDRKTRLKRALRIAKSRLEACCNEFQSFQRINARKMSSEKAAEKRNKIMQELERLDSIIVMLGGKSTKLDEVFLDGEKNESVAPTPTVTALRTPPRRLNEESGLLGEGQSESDVAVNHNDDISIATVCSTVDLVEKDSNTIEHEVGTINKVKGVDWRSVPMTSTHCKGESPNIEWETASASLQSNKTTSSNANAERNPSRVEAEVRDDRSDSNAPQPARKVRRIQSMRLPSLQFNWMSPLHHKECKYFKKKQRCPRRNMCGFSHVYNKNKHVQQVPTRDCAAMRLDLREGLQVHEENHADKDQGTCYTCGWIDPITNTRYYAMDGLTVGKSTKNVYFYETRDDAIKALENLLISADGVNVRVLEGEAGEVFE